MIMATEFMITIEEDLTLHEAEELLSDFEEAVGKKSYSLDNAQYELYDPEE